MGSLSTPHTSHTPRTSLIWRLGILIGVFLAPSRARAQAADRVFPPGGQRGTTVTLTFPGMDKAESGTLVVDGDGVRPLGPFVKGVGKVEIAADAEPGIRQLRLVGPKSATAPRPFAVGVLPEMLEQEPNDTFDRAQRIEQLPLTLNGAIPKPQDIDAYRVSLKKGECLVVASESRRLAGPVYLALTVRDAQSRTLPVSVDTRRRDPVFTCPIPADGEYFLQFCDVTSNMGNVDEGCQYRLHLTTGPWLDFAAPPSVARGTTARLTAYGWNLGGRPGPGDVALEYPVPADAGSEVGITGAGAPNRLTLPAAGPEVGEAEPNNTPDLAQGVSLPAALHGVFGTRGDLDVFRFAARAGETLRIEVESRDLESLADPQFTLLDPSGKSVLSVDDAERSRDPRAFWTVPKDGTYTLILQDLAGGSRGGLSSYYRLVIAPAEPELSVAARDSTLVVKPGEKAEWNLTVYQAYQPEEITLRIEGLPEGVTAEPVRVAPLARRSGQAQAKLVLTAAAGAKPAFGVVRIVAETGGKAPRTVDAAWMLTGDGGVPLGTGSTGKLVVLLPAP